MDRQGFKSVALRMTLGATFVLVGIAGQKVLTAETTVPHIFQNGAIADAAQVNDNFGSLARAIDTADSKVRTPRWAGNSVGAEGEVIIDYQGGGVLHSIRWKNNNVGYSPDYIDVAIDDRTVLSIPAHKGIKLEPNGWFDVDAWQVNQEDEIRIYEYPIPAPGLNFHNRLRVSTRGGGGAPFRIYTVLITYSTDD